VPNRVVKAKRATQAAIGGMFPPAALLLALAGYAAFLRVRGCAILPMGLIRWD
jgi:hypothetical protein